MFTQKQYPYLLGLSIMGCLSTPSTSNTVSNIIEALQHSDQEAVRVVQQITDPVEKTLAISEVMERFPHKSKVLCGELPSSVSQERCLKLQERPHLWKTQKNILDIPSPSITTEPMETCTIDPYPNTCWTALAKQHTYEQNIPTAHSACAQIEDAKWQAECFFSIAEELASDPTKYPQSVATCVFAQQFAKSCWHHGIKSLASHSIEHINDWQWHNDIAQLIEDAHSDHVDIAHDLLSHFWAEAIHRQITHQADTLSIDLSSLPREALPHYRSSVAVETLRFGDYPLQYIDKWIDIAKRYPNIEKREKARGLDLGIDLWTHSSTLIISDQTSPLVYADDKDDVCTHPNTTNCRVVSFLGNSHRMSCDDEKIDWTIAILEASARLRPHQYILLQEGRAHPMEIVQQTVQRLEISSSLYTKKDGF